MLTFAYSLHATASKRCCTTHQRQLLPRQHPPTHQSLDRNRPNEVPPKSDQPPSVVRFFLDLGPAIMESIIDFPNKIASSSPSYKLWSMLFFPPFLSGMFFGLLTHFLYEPSERNPPPRPAFRNVKASKVRHCPMCGSGSTPMAQLPCLHVYCRSCIRNHLSGNEICPLCSHFSRLYRASFGFRLEEIFIFTIKVAWLIGAIMLTAHTIVQIWDSYDHPWVDLLLWLCDTWVAVCCFFGIQAYLYVFTSFWPRDYRDFQSWRTQLLIASVGLLVLLTVHPIACQAVKDEVQAWLQLETASESEATCPAIMGLIGAGY